MSERPILFSGPMVRAILEGRKSQTRRVIKTHSPAYIERWKGAEGWDKECSYGQPGDLLWVRETWYPAFRRDGDSNGCVYRADDNGRDLNPGWSPNGKGGGWKSSIHMPRWASRLTLRITKVRVERLQEISGDDCIAEGIQIPVSEDRNPLLRLTGRVLPSRFSKHPKEWKLSDFARFEYAELWEQINGKGSWDLNPWVWVIEFERAQQQEKAA